MLLGVRAHVCAVKGFMGPCVPRCELMCVCNGGSEQGRSASQCLCIAVNAPG